MLSKTYKKEAEEQLLKSLSIAYSAGLINIYMIDWVKKAMERAKQNQEFFRSQNGNENDI